MNLLLEVINKRFLLSRDYLIIISTIIILLFLVIALYSWLSYKTYLQDENKKIIETSTKIEQSLEESFNYSCHLIAYLASQIEDLPSKDADSITKLLRSKLTSDQEAKKLFSWTLFDWIDNKNQLRLSVLNKVTEAIDVSDRDYINFIRNEPFVLQFSKPSIGKPSGQWIIPAAFGIKDKSNNFLGAIGFGFNIINLQKTIEREIANSNNLIYLVLNDKLEVVIPSSALNLDKKNYNILDLTKSFIFPNRSAEFFNKSIHYKNFSLVYFRKMINRPFFVLVGYNKNFRNKEIQNIIIGNASGIIIISLVFLVILLIFQKIIVQPIVELSNAAEKIISTGGTENVFLPESNIKEFKTLSLRLIDLSNFIQKLKSQEKEIKQINNELEFKVSERTRQLKQALEVKTEFLNNMSHEIRTPVQGFLGISEALDINWNQYTDKQKHFYTNIIAKNAQRLASLVGNLLDLTKFNDGKLFLEIRKIDLNKVIVDLIEECKTLYLSDKKIKFAFTCPQSKLEVLADEERIIQVLRNLLINSIKFSPNDSIINIILTTTVLIYDNTNKAIGVHCTIIDQGIGIPDNELKSIFDPFIQSSRSKNKAGGTGLGLSICNKIINAHHGKIWAENNSDQKGSAFHLIIPNTHDKKLEIHQTIQEKNINQFNDIKTILVIDDEDIILSTIDIILTANNYKTILANRGIYGLELIRKNYKKIDLVLLDLMMPDMHGLEVLEELKKDPKTKNIPVIMQSGVADEKEKQSCFKYGALSFLSKPYNKNELLHEIKKTLTDISY